MAKKNGKDTTIDPANDVLDPLDALAADRELAGDADGDRTGVDDAGDPVPAVARLSEPSSVVSGKGKDLGSESRATPDVLARLREQGQELEAKFAIDVPDPVVPPRPASAVEPSGVVHPLDAMQGVINGLAAERGLTPAEAARRPIPAMQRTTVASSFEIDPATVFDLPFELPVCVDEIDHRKHGFVSGRLDCELTGDLGRAFKQLLVGLRSRHATYLHNGQVVHVDKPVDVVRWLACEIILRQEAQRGSSAL